MKPFAVVVACVILSAMGHAQQTSNTLLTTLDHLVYATPDLQRGIDAIEQRLGVKATPGGQHPGLGTRNALVALGPTSYLEIIGPDPDQPKPAGPRRFGIDGLQAPRIVRWVVKSSELAAVSEKAAKAGVTLGALASGSRRRPDGVVLAWRYTDPATVVADGLVPFFIDWGSSPHPALTAAKGATLVQMRAEHPEASRVQKMLDQLGLELRVSQAAASAIIATIDSPRGRVELR
jgi:Glyoxalase-like domain